MMPKPPSVLWLLVVLLSMTCGQDSEEADVQEVSADDDDTVDDDDSGRRAEALLNKIVDYGIEQSKFLKDVQERELFDEGLKLDKFNPAHFVGVFNKEKPRARELSEYAYASLEASSLLARQ